MEWERHRGLVAARVGGRRGGQARPCPRPLGRVCQPEARLKGVDGGGRQVLWAQVDAVATVVVGVDATARLGVAGVQALAGRPGEGGGRADASSLLVTRAVITEVHSL